MMAVKHVPEGFHTVTPYLVCDDVPRVIDFVKKAFDAVELERSVDPKGRVMHAQVRIGDSIVMMGGSMETFPAAPAQLYLYVPDTDVLYKKAMAAGGVSIMEPTNHFYGDRSGGVQDPAGNKWWIATHIEDVSPEEMKRRIRERM